MCPGWKFKLVGKTSQQCSVKKCVQIDVWTCEDFVCVLFQYNICCVKDMVHWWENILSFPALKGLSRGPLLNCYTTLQARKYLNWRIVQTPSTLEKREKLKYSIALWPRELHCQHRLFLASTSVKFFFLYRTTVLQTSCPSPMLDLRDDVQVKSLSLPPFVIEIAIMGHARQTSAIAFALCKIKVVARSYCALCTIAS